MRKYIIANDLPPYNPKTCRVDEWWREMDDKNEFTILKTMVCALLSCFLGTAVEILFNVMGDIIGVKSANTTVQTYASYQAVKYHLKSAKKCSFLFAERRF